MNQTKHRSWLWFIGLYAAGLFTLSCIAYGLKSLMTLL